MKSRSKHLFLFLSCWMFSLVLLSGILSPTFVQAETPRELVSGERVRVQKLTSDMHQFAASINTKGPSSFQNPDDVAAKQKRFQQFEEAIRRYPQAEDVDVQAARAAFESLRLVLTTEFQRARQQLAELGDVQQRLATLDENSRNYAVPAALEIPFDETQAQAWVTAASQSRTVAEHNLQELASIATLAYLPNNPGTPETGAAYDAQDVARLQRNAEFMLVSINTNYQQMAQSFNHLYIQIDNDVLSRWQFDPVGDKAWHFISDGQPQTAIETYDAFLRKVQSAVYLEKALGRDASQAQTVAASLSQAKQTFLQNHQAALTASKLPVAKSDDKALITFAKEILANPRYVFGEHGRIVPTTAEITHHERKDSEIDIDKAEISLGGDLKMSGTQTTWHYKWQEFKFAVPLKEVDSDQWYIWWITAKNFSSGSEITPLNQWVSGAAVKGNAILAKNI